MAAMGRKMPLADGSLTANLGRSSEGRSFGLSSKLSESFGWFIGYHFAELSGNIIRTDWPNRACLWVKNGRFARGALVYTERVGGSSPSPPTTEKRGFLAQFRERRPVPMSTDYQSKAAIVGADDGPHPGTRRERDPSRVTLWHRALRVRKLGLSHQCTRAYASLLMVVASDGAQPFGHS